MKIATWNVNSIKARLGVALQWLCEAKPDIVALQEIKCVDDAFPREAFEALGYSCAVHGQKSYNGVALLSRLPMEDVIPRLPGDDDGDDHARYLEASIRGNHGMIRVASIYAPNGNPIGTAKFSYKLSWLDRLTKRAATLIQFEEPVMLMGDYNIIPDPADVYDPAAWSGDALYQPESRAALRHIEFLGYSDAFRSMNSESGQYTFWDYQAGMWRKNQGIRIDHLLLSPQASDRLRKCEIDKHVRAGERPSDHVPIWCELQI